MACQRSEWNCQHRDSRKRRLLIRQSDRHDLPRVVFDRTARGRATGPACGADGGQCAGAGDSGSGGDDSCGCPYEGKSFTGGCGIRRHSASSVPSSKCQCTGSDERSFFRLTISVIRNDNDVLFDTDWYDSPGGHLGRSGTSAAPAVPVANGCRQPVTAAAKSVAIIAAASSSAASAAN